MNVYTSFNRDINFQDENNTMTCEPFRGGLSVFSNLPLILTMKRKRSVFIDINSSYEPMLQS